ncbi:MAG: GDSL-type esterase/lipase family protein [Myxococcota bacterium]
MPAPSHSDTTVSDDTGLLDVEERVEEVVLTAGDEQGEPPAPGTFGKIGSGMATLVVLIGLTYLVPALDWARPWVAGKDPVPFWNLVGRELLGEGESLEKADAKTEEAERIARAMQDDEGPVRQGPVIEPPPKGTELPPYEPHPDDEEAVTQSLELPTPTALDSFYASLARTDASYAGAITRVSHWGDSVIANDNVSSAMRFLMQRRFGDAGHGFHLVAKPNPSYRHQGVRFFGGEDWQLCYIINRCQPDGLYGFGGTMVWSTGGAESQWKTESKLALGRSASRLELWYRARPKSGRVRVKIDSEAPRIVETAGPEGDAWQTLEFPDGPHSITLRAGASGKVRLYGVVLEREGPGVVWDGMAQLGAFSRKMLLFDPEHLRTQIDHRDPALLVFSFGGNDLTIPPHKLERYEQDFTEMLRRFAGTEDPRACVVMAPVDHGLRQGQRIVSLPMVARIVEIQRRVALAEGCAFFDTVAAMGGDGAAARWRRANPPLLSGDLAHLSHAGQKVIGRMAYLALMEGYVEYRRRTE